jgi:uncharacterized protein
MKFSPNFVARPKFLLWMTLVISFFLLPGITRLKSILSLDDIVDPQLASSIRNLALKENFPAGPSLIFMAKVNPEKTQHVLCELKGKIETIRLQYPSVRSIVSPFTIRTYVENSIDQTAWYPRLLESVCSSSALPALQNSQWLGLVSNEDFSSFIVSVEFDREDDFHQQAHELRNDFQEFFGALDTQIDSSGTLGFELDMKKGLRFSMLLNLLILVIVAISIRFIIGTWKASFILLYSLTIATAWIYSLMGYLDVPIDMLTQSLFLLLAVCSLQDFVFLSLIYRRCGSWTQAFEEQRLPAFLTSLTSIVGFWSLMSSPLDIISRFGFWVGLAALFEWIALFVLTPPLLKCFPYLQSWTTQQMDFVLLKFKSLWTYVPSRRTVAISCLAYLSVPLMFLGVLNLSVYDDSTEIFPKNHGYRTSVENLKNEFGWAGDISLVFDSEPSQEFSERLLSQLRELEGIVHVENIAGFTEDLTSLTSNPFSKARIAREILRSGEAERYLSKYGPERRWVLYTSKVRSDDLSKLVSELDVLCQGQCQTAGTFDAYAEFSSEIPQTLLTSFLLSLSMVALCIFIVFRIRRPHEKIMSVLPWLLASFWGPAAMLWIVSLGAIKINYVTCIFVVILVGLTGDNAIQFLCGPKISGGNKSSGVSGVELKQGASLICTIMMSVASLVFLLSYFEPPRIFGGLLSIGLALSLWGDVWLLKGFIKEDQTRKH